MFATGIYTIGKLQKKGLNVCLVVLVARVGAAYPLSPARDPLRVCVRARSTYVAHEFHLFY